MSTEIATDRAERHGLTSRLPRASTMLDYGIVGAVVGLFLVLAFTAPNFATFDNLINILDQNAFLAVTAFAATLVIIAGGFDLSVGAIFAFGGVIAAWVAVNISPELGIAAGLMTGVVVGLVNGVLITGLRVHSFLITLAMGIILTGFSIAVTGGQLINANEYPVFTWLGQEELIPEIPNPILVMVICGLILSFLLQRTTYGRYVFAVGGNPVAARLAGVRVNHVIILTFVISGLMAAMAGLMEVSRNGTGQADPGNASGLALDAIAAVVIGGTSIMGGRGAVWRTALGVLLLALIENGFNLLGVAPEWRNIVSGVVIIAAVGLNALGGRR